jgi:hypothetical protein
LRYCGAWDFPWGDIETLGIAFLLDHANASVRQWRSKSAALPLCNIGMYSVRLVRLKNPPGQQQGPPHGHEALTSTHGLSSAPQFNYRRYRHASLRQEFSLFGGIRTIRCLFSLRPTPFR